MLSDALTSLRALSFDDRATYFEQDPALPGSPRTERALHIRLLPLLRDASQSDVSLADDMRRNVLATSDSPAECDPQAAQFDHWMMCHWDSDLLPTNLKLSRFAASGRGLAAFKHDIEAGDTVLAVPERLILTAEHAREKPEVAAAIKRAESFLDHDLEEDVLLAIALMIQQVYHPSGPWATYLTLLPASPSNALLWQAAQLGRMGGTPLPFQVLAVRRALRGVWSTLVQHLVGQSGSPLPARAFSWRRFLWAYSLVESRGM